MFRCLVVDDNNQSRLLLEKFLSPHCKCDVAKNGQEGLRKFIEAMQRGENYQLICLDIIMPRIDGLELLNSIRFLEKERGIPISQAVKVIMVSALGADESVVHAFGQGCESYLVKPITNTALTTELKKLGLLSEQDAETEAR